MPVLIVLAGIVTALVMALYLFMHSRPFGMVPAGERRARIRHSPQYRNRRFHNLHVTPNLAEDANLLNVMYRFFFRRDERNRPGKPLPSVKTDLLQADPGKDLLVWFGHSSYYIQADGKKILVDPVFSGHASPLSFTTRSYAGTDVYTTGDLPAIDYLVITHDHWDHLDYQTVKALQPKVKKLITGLGTGAHFARWGFADEKIVELDWMEAHEPCAGFIFRALPARHFSGRGFTRDQSLWTSFALRTPSYHLYLGGDSGYDTHFAAIGQQYGPFDLAILECGQYNTAWPYIHMQPEEMIQAGKELRAAGILPVHWGKFSLGLHAWDEPIERALQAAQLQQVPIVHPMIGEAVLLKEKRQYNTWWRN